MSDARRSLHVTWMGRVRYADAAKLQVEIRDALARSEGPERLLLLEHPHVYTLGRNAHPEDVLTRAEELAERGVEVEVSDRGGQVTYHGPGQLVGYPILDLAPDRRDLRRYVRDLEEVLVRLLAGLGIPAEAGEGERIGVWTRGRKIGSLGIHLARWRTTHGFALNVSTDLGLFGGIVACGLPEVEMTSIERETGRTVPLAELAGRLVPIFAEVFARRPVDEPEFAGALAAGARG